MKSELLKCHSDSIRQVIGVPGTVPMHDDYIGVRGYRNLSRAKRAFIPAHHMHLV